MKKLRFKAAEAKPEENPFPGVTLVGGDEDIDENSGGYQVDFYDSPYIPPKFKHRTRNIRTHTMQGFDMDFFIRDPWLVLIDLMRLASYWGFSGVALGGVYEIQTPTGIYTSLKPYHRMDVTSPAAMKRNIQFYTWEQLDELEKAGKDPIPWEHSDNIRFV